MRDVYDAMLAVTDRLARAVITVQDGTDEAATIKATKIVLPDRVFDYLQRQMAFVSQQGVVPIVVTEKANRDGLRRELKREDYENAIVLNSFRKPMAAADELGRIVLKRGMRFSNWLNITDDTTAFFLYSCERLGSDFEFRRAYERCRVKPMTRRILAKAGLCRVRFDVHDIDDCLPPHRFLFPFIAKPILGAGSKGVALISGSRHWGGYLRQIRADLMSDDVSIREFAPGRQVLVEEILAGQECQLDGVVEGGRVKFCALGIKTTVYESHGYREVRGMLCRTVRA
jgi:hypothetical protein